MVNSTALKIDLPKHILGAIASSKDDRQTYLNSLALYAADLYLQCLQFETRGGWWMPYLTHSATLELAKIGKLECIPVVSDAKIATISPDLKADRVGYLFVRINEVLTSAEIIGFMPEYSYQVELDRLQSTDNLIDYLCDREPVLTRLKMWLDGIFDGSWQEIDNLQLAPVYRSPAYRTRSRSVPDGESLLAVKSTERGRKIELGDRPDSPSVIITVGYQQMDTQDYDLYLQVFPQEPQKTLPVGMKFKAIDDRGNEIGAVETAVGDISGEIVLEHGKPGERFSVEIEFEGIEKIELFEI